MSESTATSAGEAISKPGSETREQSTAKACPALQILAALKAGETQPCSECGTIFADQSFSITKIKIGATDKNNAKVEEIYWSSRDFSVYRSERGVTIHFSDCAKVEKDQRALYATIAVKLYQLRSILDQLAKESLRTNIRGSFYDAQIAQALALAIDNKTEQATQILDEGIRLATQRAANENRIAYLLSCVASGFILILLTSLTLLVFNFIQPTSIYQHNSPSPGWGSYLGLAIYPLIGFVFVVSFCRLALYTLASVEWITHLIVCTVSGLTLVLLAFAFTKIQSPSWDAYLMAGIAGAVGAVFSISLRVSGLELAPSQQSTMNYLLGALRVLIGFGSGVILLLICTHTSIGDPIVKVLDTSRGAITDRSVAGWGYAAFLGVAGGFAERLVPNLLGQLQNQSPPQKDVGTTPVLQGIVPNTYKISQDKKLSLELHGMNLNSVKTVKVVSGKTQALGTYVFSSDTVIKCEVDMSAFENSLVQKTSEKCDIIVVDDKLNSSTLPAGLDIQRN
jgi:hypothetical protein